MLLTDLNRSYMGEYIWIFILEYFENRNLFIRAQGLVIIRHLFGDYAEQPATSYVRHLIPLLPEAGFFRTLPAPLNLESNSFTSLYSQNIRPPVQQDSRSKRHVKANALPLSPAAAIRLLPSADGQGWVSRLLKNNLMEDITNNVNENFMQEPRLIENEYSINLPVRFYYNNVFANVM